MLFQHYSKKEVKEIVRRVAEEYQKRISAQQTRIDDLLEKNRELSAKLSVLEGKEEEISSAILTSVEAGKKLEERTDAYIKNRLQGLKLLSERLKERTEALKEKYPEADDLKDFDEFFSRMEELMGEEDDFSREMREEPQMDLEALCRELGIAEGDEAKEFVFFDDDEDEK